MMVGLVFGMQSETPFSAIWLLALCLLGPYLKRENPNVTLGKS